MRNFALAESLGRGQRCTAYRLGTAPTRQAQESIVYRSELVVGRLSIYQLGVVKAGEYSYCYRRIYHEPTLYKELESSMADIREEPTSLCFYCHLESTVRKRGEAWVS